jgi:lipid II:glycine glycyltransferase (peptidoglycan interpeptide bridge formation enzyme)
MTGSNQNSDDQQRSPSPPLKKSVIETRRAEQNRAAQRAFRQRKEKYVKELEQKVNAMADWPMRMEQLEKENERLKRHICTLEQSLAKRTKLEEAESILPPIQNNTASIKQTSATMTTVTNTNTTTAPATKTNEKGQVLDNLVTLLRSRHRPPIPSHPPN